MKDRQVEHAASQPRIPVVSALLHCAAMSALVYLRSGFGYAFLKPKSIFLSGAWAFILFTIVVTTEGLLRQYAWFCLFGVGASLLYFLHLSWAFASELRGTATHDNDSGTPHMLRILNMAGVQPKPEFRKFWVLWAEPTFVLFLAVAARWPFGAENLSNWLLFVVPSMWLKEALNHWLQIRHTKRQRDTMADAEEGIDVIHPQAETPSTAGTRKEKVKRQRTR